MDKLLTLMYLQDRITQLQDAILDLLTITAKSIEFVTKRTQFEQTSTAIPTTLQTPHAAGRAEYKASIETFVADIIRRSKDIKLLIAALPKKEESEGRAERLIELQKEMELANEEYKAALSQSEELLLELQTALDQALGQGADGLTLSTHLIPRADHERADELQVQSARHNAK